MRRPKRINRRRILDEYANTRIEIENDYEPISLAEHIIIENKRNSRGLVTNIHALVWAERVGLTSSREARRKLRVRALMADLSERLWTVVMINM